ncbi:alpha/beta fold hydrolase [Neobacillus niacini]|uniref:alpha/beta fold hydrolase n=1 Tax=Neobacillus niacini TaxID=86668 RepID=UPI0021CB0A88|nr:alpha/beta hydrolase [Neobacillus niacini]MCM3763707.1 alpha/beta hydrolase [Neobacillus niacini]
MPLLNINGNNLYYETYGNPDAQNTIMFLNGVMTTTTSWALYYPFFEKLGYRIVLHDFKGQMKSDKPEGPYTFKEHADDAKKLLEELGVEKVHLIGTSYGGEVAMRFVIDYPEAVASLVLIDAASEVDEISKLFVEGWKHLAQQQQGEAFFWGAVPSLYGNAFVAKNMDFLAERAKLMNDIEASYFAGQVNLYETYVNDLNLTGDLGRITCPTLVVLGENDLLTPRKFADMLVKNIPNTEYMIIPECGHVTIFEQPEALKTAMIGFILKHS